MSQFHILFVGHSPALHGAEYSLWRLIEKLRFKFKCTVLAPAGGPFEEKVKEIGVEFYHFDPKYPFSLKHKNQSVLPEFLCQLKRQHDELCDQLPEFDLVHSNTLYVWEGALLAASRGVPHLWNAREIPESSPTWNCSFGWPTTYDYIDQLSDRVLCVSEALRRVLPADLQEKSTVIHNGLDAKELLSRSDGKTWAQKEFGIPSDHSIAICVGNFIPEKGHERLVELMLPLLQKFSTWHLLLVGEQHFCYPSIRALLDGADPKVSARVHCPGPVAGVGKKISCADLYLCASHTEAFPTVLLEARLSHVPFISTDCGGAREIAQQGGGVCAEDWELFRALVSKVLSGENLDTKAKDSSAFSMEAMADGYEAAYRKCLENDLPKSKISKRQSRRDALFCLAIDLQSDVTLRQKVVSLCALRGVGRFFRWFFKNS